MAIVSDKDWHELPGPAAAAKLIEFRNELRAKNLPPRSRRSNTLPRRRLGRCGMPAPAMAPTTTWPVRAWVARECDSGATSH